MKFTNAFYIKARASQVGYIMPSDNAKKDFTDTQIDKMIEMYNDQVYSRRDEVDSKYFTKGNERENDSITLVSRVMKKMFRKNTTRLSNEFISGEWDLDVEENGKIIETIDTKSSWSKITFDKARAKKLNAIYKYQGHAYMWLTGAVKHTIAYCLVNGTFQQINDEIRKLSWKMGVLDASVETNPKFIEKVKQIERNHIFDLNAFMEENPGYDLKNEYEIDVDREGKYLWEYDILFEKRIHTFVIERDEKIMKQMQDRIIECRAWINKNLFNISV